jgi:Ser/Thr protein kinase RdoA (MazF antagonist)
LSEDQRHRVLSHIDFLTSQIPSAELRQVPVHSDLAMGNILVSGKRVVVLDFAMAKTGTALHDLARLFVQVDLLAVKPHVQERVVRRLEESLLAGYDPALSVNRPLFRLLVLLHRVNHVVTLLFQPARFIEAAYNRLVLHRHYRWLTDELARSGLVKAPV